MFHRKTHKEVYQKMADKKPSRFLFSRTMGSWLISLIAFLILNWFMDSVSVSGLITAAIFVSLLSLTNSVIRPFILAITLPVTILTLGVFSLVINAFLIVVVADLVPGVSVNSFSSAIWLSVGLSLVNTFFQTLFAIDDVELYESYVLRRRTKNQKQIVTDKPGVAFIEIDGLSHPAMQRAIQNAYMPNLAKLLRDSHHLVGWECDFASSTPASQAGLLLGNNEDIPAFRWYDRNKGRIVSMSKMKDTVEVEKLNSKKTSGLLSKGGVSINNMFSGGAKSFILTSSKLTGKGSVRKQSGLYYFFANSYNFIRTFFLYWIDVFYEIKDRAYQSRQDVWPRLPFHFTYPFIRGVTTIFMREMAISAIIGKMMEGVPSLYATLLAYDEIAHHSGVERSQSMYMLQQLDKQFAKILKATEYTPRPYHIVFLSDHGQSQGATFLQRYNLTLEELIQQLTSQELKINRAEYTDESWDRINTFLTDISKSEKKAPATIVKTVTKKSTQDGSIDITKNKPTEVAEAPSTQDQQELVVLASGNLGLVYFTQFKNRLSLEKIESNFPNLIPGLVNHPGIGFVVVQSKKGPLVIGEPGIYNLKTDRISGENPLADFPSTTVQHLKRHANFKHLPDLMINSFYNPGTDEICAFEELIGAHGGIGGNQNIAFLMYPKELETERLNKLVGTHQVHQILKDWAFAAA